MKKLIWAAPLLLATTGAMAADKTQCVTTDKAQIEGLFDRWNAALKTGKSANVAKLYQHDAVLLPTVSNKVRLTDAERVDYFDHFLEKQPVGKIDSRTVLLGCNEAIDVGTYTFTFNDKSSVSARYTFTYAWNGSEWKISTHHSSAMPES